MPIGDLHPRHNVLTTSHELVNKGFMPRVWFFISILIVEIEVFILASTRQQGCANNSRVPLVALSVLFFTAGYRAS